MNAHATRRASRRTPAPRPRVKAAPTRRGRRAREGYACTFTIPAAWWDATGTPITERRRAASRRMVREYARKVWRQAVEKGGAWRVKRYVAVIGVQYPEGLTGWPAEAAETVKPVIDAGTDTGLWPDDDASHRCATVYHLTPGHCTGRSHVLTVMVLPVPDRAPEYVASRDLNRAIMQRAGMGYAAQSIRIGIPFELWVTSNITDSDLMARQHGRRKADSWGGWKAYGTRGKVTERLAGRAFTSWSRNPMPPMPWESYMVLAGVGYATGGDADPDNAAETVNTLIDAGVQAGMLPGTSPDRLKAVVFFRLREKAEPWMHDVKLYAVRLPAGVQWLDCLADSVQAAWAEWDARRGGGV